MLRMREGRTHVALNTHSAPTAAFVHNTDWKNPGEDCAGEIARAVGVAAVGSFDADAAATKLMGDSIYTNPHAAGLRLAKGLDSAGAAIAAARHRTQRRGGGQQQGRVRVGPARRARSAGRGRAGVSPGR